MNKIIETFKLGSHYKIERFSVLFLTLVVCLTMVSFNCFSCKVEFDEANARTKAMYTTDIAFSRTGNAGTVENVYTSKNKKRTFVLLHFEEPNNMILDASNYKIFITASDINGRDYRLLNTPAGAFYVFGSTGYMGLYLINSSGFSGDILNIIIRSGTEIVANKSDTDKDISEQTSFDKFDQAKFYFNPSGEGASSLECLDQETPPTLFDLYEQSVSRTKETEIRAALDSDLEAMNLDMGAMSEYESRLKRDGVLVEDPPYLIAGDQLESVYYNTETNAIQTSTPDDASKCQRVWDYQPVQILAGGFDFDWRTGTVRDGYLSELAGTRDYSKYFVEKGKEFDTIKFSVEKDWYMSNGMSVDDLRNNTVESEYNRIENDINLLTNAWTSYYEHKKQYQTVDLKNLLMLEVDLQRVTYDSTMNMSDDLIVCY